MRIALSRSFGTRNDPGLGGVGLMWSCDNTPIGCVLMSVHVTARVLLLDRVRVVRRLRHDPSLCGVALGGPCDDSVVFVERVVRI